MSGQASEPASAWGLWDQRDLCWVGNNEDETGPRTFADRTLARYVAGLASLQLDRSLPAEFIVVRPYDGSGTRKKDEVPLRYEWGRAMELLESDTRVAPMLREPGDDV